MNRPQYIALGSTAAVLVVNLLVPPWVHTFQYPGMGQSSRRPAGYALIFSPPPQQDVLLEQERRHRAVLAAQSKRERLENLPPLPEGAVLDEPAEASALARARAALKAGTLAEAKIAEETAKQNAAKVIDPKPSYGVVLDTGRLLSQALAIILIGGIAFGVVTAVTRQRSAPTNPRSQ